MLLSKVLSNCSVDDVCPQLSPVVIAQCKEAGIRTVVDFVLCEAEELAKKIKTPYKDVAAIRNFLLVEFSAFPQSGDSFYEISLQTALIIKTGCKRLNDFLSGGIYTGEITEIHGPSGAGKTQFCFSVACSFLLKHTSVLYVNTNNSFSVKRVNQILLHRLGFEKDCSLQYAVENMLQHLEVRHVNNIYHLFDVLHNTESSLHDLHHSISQHMKLIIIDSLTHLLAPYLGGSQFDGHGLMMSVAQMLKRLCRKHNLSIIVCNNTVVGEAMTTKPALGPNWKYVPSVTLCINKTNEKGGGYRNLHTIKRVKSCRNGTFGELSFNISEFGIKE